MDRPALTEKVLNEVLEDALSPRARELLNRGIEDAKAGRVSVVDLEKLKRDCAALDSVCPQCDTKMEPEHAHYRCPKCHYRDSCCF